MSALSLYTEAVQCLEKEIIPKPSNVGTSVEYRKSVAIGLFYKVSILSSRWFIAVNFGHATIPAVLPRINS